MKHLILPFLCILFSSSVFSQDKKKKAKDVKTEIIGPAEWKWNHYVILIFRAVYDIHTGKVEFLEETLFNFPQPKK